MVERQIEPPVDVGLRRVLSRAVGGDVDIGLGCGELRRRAVLVGGADVERVRAGLATEAGMDVGRQQRARKVAEMLDAVDVRQGTGDEISGHDALRSMMSADPESKTLRRKGGFWVRFIRTARVRLQSLQQVSCGTGIRISKRAAAKVMKLFQRCRRQV